MFFAVELTILKSLRQMAQFDLLFVVEISDGPRDPPDAVIRSGRKSKMLERVLKHRFGPGVDLTVFFELGGA